MRQIREFRSNFENISHDCRAIVLLSVSSDCREGFACCLNTVARPLCDIRTSTSVAKISYCKFAKILRRQVRDTRTKVARPSHDSLAKYFGEKIRIKFSNMFKTFATSSRYMKILTTFVRHSNECHANVRDKIRKTVTRNSHTSEILA